MQIDLLMYDVIPRECPRINIEYPYYPVVGGFSTERGVHKNVTAEIKFARQAIVLGTTLHSCTPRLGIKFARPVIAQGTVAHL